MITRIFTYYTLDNNQVLIPHDLKIEAEYFRISDSDIVNVTWDTEALYYVIRVFSENYNEYIQSFKPGNEWFEAITEGTIVDIIEEQIESIRWQYNAI